MISKYLVVIRTLPLYGAKPDPKVYANKYVSKRRIKKLFQSM